MKREVWSECVIVDPVSALPPSVADNNSRLCCSCELTRKTQQRSSRASRSAPTDSFISSTFQIGHDWAAGASVCVCYVVDFWNEDTKSLLCLLSSVNSCSSCISKSIQALYFHCIYINLAHQASIKFLYRLSQRWHFKHKGCSSHWPLWESVIKLLYCWSCGALTLHFLQVIFEQCACFCAYFEYIWHVINKWIGRYTHQSK